MDFHLMEIKDVLAKLNSSLSGISSKDAKARLDKFGNNEFEQSKKIPLVLRFIKQILDPMIIILLVAATVSAFISIINNQSFADVIIILFVVVLNAVLGVYQETKAERSIESLKQMTAQKSIVIRQGKQMTIESKDLVIGDIVVLECGDAIPADGRIIESKMLKIEESALTGESIAVDKLIDVLNCGEDQKNIDLADRLNMAYMGTSVVYGRGKMLVTATGMDTEMGKIAGALQNAKEKRTPLQLKMDQLSKALTWVVVIISIIVFGLQLLTAGIISAEVILTSFMIAISLAVAAIPEGLPAVVTVALSIGVSKMSKRNAIIRKLTAVETLGCAQIICSDKTGTLTQNKMTVRDFYGDEALLKKAMGLCNDASIEDGEPTEVALYTWSQYDKNLAPRIAEIPFDSSRKMMSTLHDEDGNKIQFTKGAIDEVLKRCVDVDIDIVYEENKKMTDKALRVLACAMRTGDEIVEEGMKFIGLVGMIDPVRPEVKDAIIQCEYAGIKPIMITGDHIDTAKAIAKELEILNNDEIAISGAMLDEMSEDEFISSLEKISVYARVRPEHKSRIVNAWQKAGYVVSMTGDGVNDAPSIKEADIGVGMGITGTDVTKNAADMVLADDNFATIVNAVEEGRRIYENILKCIQYLLSSNTGEVLCVFFASLFGFVILQPVQILWVNLVTDCVPALALSVEEKEPNIMNRKPRSKSAGIFADCMGFDIIYQGVIITILILLSFVIGHFEEFKIIGFKYSEHGMSMAFLTMSMVGCFHSINLRSRRESIFKLKKQNLILLASLVISLVLTLIVCIEPTISSAFKITTLQPIEWITALLLGFSIIPIVEIIKFFQRKISKNSMKILENF